MVIKWPFSGPLMALDKPYLYQNYKVNANYRVPSDTQEILVLLQRDMT